MQAATPNHSVCPHAITVSAASPRILPETFCCSFASQPPAGILLANLHRTTANTCQIDEAKLASDYATIIQRRRGEVGGELEVANLLPLLPSPLFSIYRYSQSTAIYSRSVAAARSSDQLKSTCCKALLAAIATSKELEPPTHPLFDLQKPQP